MGGRVSAGGMGGGSGLDAFADLEPAPAKAANISSAQPPRPPPRGPAKRTMMPTTHTIAAASTSVTPA